MPKHELEIVRDEHNATINAKRVSLVAASTIYAVVNTGAAGDSTANIGFATVAVSTPTLYAVVNTSAAGVGNSIVTVANPVSLAGNVTLDAGSKTGIVGNVTLSDSKSFIGLTTTVIGSAPTIFAVVNTAAAGDSLNKIGFATVYVSGNVTLSDSKGFIGLTTTVLGSAPTLYAVVNTGAAGDSTANIGFATVNVANTVTVDSELPSAVTLAEGVANPTAPAVGSYLMGWNGSDWSRAFMYAPADNSASDRGILTNDRMMVYDGANWDMLRGDAANGMLVNLGANNDVSIAAGINSIGFATVAVSNIARTITGNVTLSDSKTYIGLVTATPVGLVTVIQGTSPWVSSIIGNLTLSDSKGFIGLVTVANVARTITGNLTLSDSKGFIGLVTVANTARTITGNVTLSDAKTYVGLTTTTLGIGTTFIGLTTSWALNAGTTKTIVPKTIAMSAGSIATIAVPTGGTVFKTTNLVLNSDATVRVSIKSGATYLTGNATIGITLNPGGGWVETGSPDSPTYIGLAADTALVIEKFDMTGTVAKISGKINYFLE